MLEVLMQNMLFENCLLRKANAELKSELSALKSRHQHVLDHLDDAIVQLDELQEALEENAIVVVINVE